MSGNMRKFLKFAYCAWFLLSVLDLILCLIEPYADWQTTAWMCWVWVLNAAVGLMNLWKEYPETKSWAYWRTRFSFSLWKPKAYPANINDLVAEEYRRRLFRNSKQD